MGLDLAYRARDIVINDLKQLELSEGIEKVKQDVEFILMTVKGSDIFHPDFGVDWITIKQTKFNRMLIEHEIRKALSKYEKIKIDRIEVSEPDSERKIRIKLFLIVSNQNMAVEVRV